MTGRHLDPLFSPDAPPPAAEHPFPGFGDDWEFPRRTKTPEPSTSAAPRGTKLLAARLPREVDSTNEARVRLDLLTILHACAPYISGLIIDMTHTSFIDSAGLRALRVVQTRADQLAAPLCVVAPDRHVRRLLRLVDITERIPMVDSMDAALCAFAPRPESAAAPHILDTLTLVK